MNTIMKKLFLASLAVSFTVMAAGGTNPVLNIKGNGLANQVTLNPSSVLSIKVDMEPDSLLGCNADWWVVAATPWGHWYYYVYPNKWIDAGTDLSGISSAYQGQLFDLPSFELIKTLGLPKGIYTFYFGVDMKLNNLLDLDQLYYNKVDVNVQ